MKNLMLTPMNCTQQRAQKIASQQKKEGEITRRFLNHVIREFGYPPSLKKINERLCFNSDE